MTLPHDIARCTGRMATRATPGAPAISISIGHVECLACQRHTNPGRPDRPQTMMGPPPFERGHCPERIAPTPTTQPAQTKAGFFTPEP